MKAQRKSAEFSDSSKNKHAKVYLHGLGKQTVQKRIVIYEVIAFIFMIFIIWLNEILDIPQILLGAEATPVNWREALFESLVIIIIAVVIITFTCRILKQMKYLEGLLPICSLCKKIRDRDGNWQYLECYISERSDAEFTHSICPECAKKIVPSSEKKSCPVISEEEDWG